MSRIKIVFVVLAAVVLLYSSSLPVSGQISTTLKLGDQKTEVTLLQKILNSIGKPVTKPGEETNYFGPLTASAIKAFQCEKGIVCAGTPETTGWGMVGPKTRSLINSLAGSIGGIFSSNNAKLTATVFSFDTDLVYYNSLDDGGAAGRVGGAKQFTGGNSTTGSSVLLGDTYTYALWMKRSSSNFSGYQTLLSKGSGSPAVVLFGESGTPNDTYASRIAMSKYFVGDAAFSQATTADTSWHHVALVKDGTTRKIYIDGVEGTTLDANRTMDSVNSAIVIGSTFQGTIDEVRVYDTALSSGEIDDLFNDDGGTPVAVNGSCGSANGGTFSSAPTSNLCSAGTASTVTGTYSWSCAGTNGGTTASCSASQTTTPNMCTSFTYSAWGACSSGSQSRTVTTSSPSGCTGGSPVLTQSCTGGGGSPITVDVYQDMEGSLTSGYGGGSWTKPTVTGTVGNVDASTSGTTPLPGPVTVRGSGVTYTGSPSSRSWSIADNTKANYMRYGFSQAQNKFTIAGFITPIAGPTESNWYKYDVVNVGEGDQATVFQIDTASTNTTTVNIETINPTLHSPSFNITRGTTYWYSFQIDMPNRTADLKLYRLVGGSWVLAGETRTTNIKLGTPVTAIKFGRADTHDTDPAQTTTYFDNILIDYTNATHPLLPTGGTVPVDTTNPTTPTSFAASSITNNSLNLSWTASTDTSGIARYNVYNGTTLIGSPTGNSFSVTGLSALTTYNFKVEAVDASANSNKSAQASVSATTLANPTSGERISGIPVENAPKAVWATAGVTDGIPNRTTKCATLNPGATAAQIQAAISACPAGQVVYLNEGTYSISPLSIAGKDNWTLRGAGMGKTILDIPSGSQSVTVGDAPPWDGDWINRTNITGGVYQQGQSTITVDNASGYSVGDMCVIDQDNKDWIVGYGVGGNGINSGTTPDQKAYNKSVAGYRFEKYGNPNDPNDPLLAIRVQTHFCRITGKSGNTLTFSPALPYALEQDRDPEITELGVRGPYKSGIEDLTVKSGQSAYGITILGTSDFWLKNVEVTNWGNLAAVWVRKNANFEMRGSFIHDPYSGLNAVNHGYGLQLDPVTGSLIIDNIIYNTQSTVLLQGGSSGNVLAYNVFAFGNYINGCNATTGVCSQNGQWLQHEISGNHTPFPSYNLFEGNYTGQFQSDYYYGPSGWGTLFRNRIPGNSLATKEHRIAVSIDSQNRNYSVVGNQLGENDPETTLNGVATSSLTFGLLGINRGYAQPQPISWQYDSGTSNFGYGEPRIYRLGYPYSGNNSSSYGFAVIDNEVKTGTLRHGNWDAANDAVVWDPAVGNTNLDSSLFLDSKPAFFGSLAWPAYGPSEPTNIESDLLKIPAGYRLLKGVGVSSTLSAPVISTHPQSQSIATGGSATLTVVATGNPIPTYQWYKDNVAVGTSASSLVVNSAGTYKVVVSNSQGSATSNDAVITVASTPDTTPPTVSITTPTNGAMVSNSATITASSSDNVGGSGLQKVDLYVKQGSNPHELLSSLTSAPYSGVWDTTTMSNGSYTLSAVAADVAGNRATSSITVTVSNTAPNSAPVLATIGNKSVAENSTLTFTASATDVDGDTLTYTTSALPSGATFANRNFSWRPDYNQSQSAPYPVTFTVTDGRGGVDTEIISITVTNTNRSPVASAGPDQTITLPSTAQLSAAGSSDPDLDTLTYAWTKVSGAGTVTFSSQNVSPVATFSGSGTYVLRVTVSDGTLQSTDEVTVIVNAIPVADDDGDGVLDVSDLCPGTKSGVSVNTRGCPLPKIATFTTKPALTATDLRSVSSLELGNAFAKVSWASPVPLVKNSGAGYDVLDVDAHLKITNGSIEMDSASLPELNHPATLTFYNVSIPNPEILKDGDICDECHIISYSNNTFVFTVPHFSVYRVVPNAAPTISLTSPTAGSYTGSVTLTASASDDLGIGSVSFYANNTLVGSDTTSPYSISYAPATGTYLLTAVATDIGGLSATSSSVEVTITAPVVNPPVKKRGGGGGGGGKSKTGTFTKVAGASTDGLCSPGQLFSTLTGQRCTTFTTTVPVTTISGTGTVAPVTGFVSSATLARDLTLGSKGEDVRTLQKFLNAKGFTIAATGAGSLGNESTTFGPATKAALIRYQKARGISPASGYFGKITRAVVGRER